MLTVFALTYAAVFAAELVGDKLLYTTGVLAARYRVAPIVVGAALAFMVKMGAAVVIGKAVSALPHVVVALLTTMSFLWVAYAVSQKPNERQDPPRPSQSSSRDASISFVLVLFSEWADSGQITTAAMAAKFASPWAVWAGAVAAMMTKGLLAAWLGAGARRWLRDRLSPSVVRYGSVALLLVLGAASVAESLLGER
jgi:Ca2+/H+ antiporter, TMEM165/GDT1 family